MASGPVDHRILKAAPALEIVSLDDCLVLATSSVTLRLEGGVGRVVRDRLLPAITANSTRYELVTSLSDLPSQELERIIDHLIAAGILLEAPVDGAREPPAWTQLVAEGLDERQRLADRAGIVRVIVVGSGQVGEAIAGVLASAGIGTVLMEDPFPAYADDLGSGPHENGPTRATVAIERLHSRWPETTFSAPSFAFAREPIMSLVADSHLVITALDPRLSAARTWVNAASLESGVPSLHVSVNGTCCDVGPLVMPGEGPCFVCWRMRAIACRDDFAVAMALEEALDADRQLPDEPRPVLPGIPLWTGGIAGHEALAVTLGIAQPRLAGHVLRLDGINMTDQLHPVVQRPDCPACRKKAPPPRGTVATLADLLTVTPRTTPFDAIAARTVSPVCGIVRKLDRLPKDVAEPELPIIVRAELANSQFRDGNAGFVGCSGKGSDIESARNGALAEALERYAALTWVPTRRVKAVRAELDGPSLHPADLVLFAEDQYDLLSYAPYRDSTVLDWVPAVSLATGGEVWVPLLAAHLGYDVPDRSAFLFPATSNGFAAGSGLTDAALRALLEVVERDAFLRCWCHRIAGSRYDARTVPDSETRDTAASYGRRGVRIDINLLPVDSQASVAMAVGWSQHLPAAVVGLGADLDPVIAARHAVKEVAQVRPALIGRLRQSATRARMAELVSDPTLVAALEDHDLLYADPKTAVTGLHYLLEPPLRAWDIPAAPRDDPATDLEQLVASLIDVAGDALYIDVTPDDVRSLKMTVVKAIVPGFQPIHFGAAEFRLGHSRLFRRSTEGGRHGDLVGRDELNLAPHPVA